ncbi:hypothetical protein IAQ61_002162 [Plenodomus lingam]|uniref:uncharacterized protein n=1 Tax=Leptosphaeria maculans TaxID=5022 RepID=UPI0033198137|nr:hypothetical protein IAQ61_002162 [Plenodomus lingam]
MMAFTSTTNQPPLEAVRPLTKIRALQAGQTNPLWYALTHVLPQYSHDEVYFGSSLQEMGLAARWQSPLSEAGDIADREGSEDMDMVASGQADGWWCARPLACLLDGSRWSRVEWTGLSTATVGM